MYTPSRENPPGNLYCKKLGHQTETSLAQLMSNTIIVAGGWDDALPERTDRVSEQELSLYKLYRLTGDHTHTHTHSDHTAGNNIPILNNHQACTLLASMYIVLSAICSSGCCHHRHRPLLGARLDAYRMAAAWIIQYLCRMNSAKDTFRATTVRGQPRPHALGPEDCRTEISCLVLPAA